MKTVAKYQQWLIKMVGVSLMALTSLAWAGSYANSVTFSGQGLIGDGFGGFDLRTELCGVANGADAEGPYLLFVLTATGASKADISFSEFGTVPMTKTGNGTFKYVSAFYPPASLVGNVTATYDGKAKNAQLVISHGCRPFVTEGAWCSPGFWMNAKDAAWALTGHTKAELFNQTVVPGFYGIALLNADPLDIKNDPSLGTVVNNPTSFGGKLGAVAGTLTAPNALTAFNAVGAFLTNNIPGYHFDWDIMIAGGSDACPIDHHGNLK
ncbi:hypothetical protein [Nitrosomonas sp.]|uniref:hypothetical protein n=1 Tax=Nitrosomonas sp. TaxID=42353 RepID=UPI002718CC64|nr:hypothetical protein [Nitrosomonas sp.]MDO8893877.1 hypothetical protein [Nitrosomonas sp.]